MGLFLFIDGPALVCRWVYFPIVWPHTSRTDEVEVTPGRFPHFFVLRSHKFALFLELRIPVYLRRKPFLIDAEELFSKIVLCRNLFVLKPAYTTAGTTQQLGLAFLH